MTQMPIPYEVLARGESLMDRLRACKTIEAVNATVREIAPAVTALAAEDPQGAHHVRNLAAYRRLCISKGWG